MNFGPHTSEADSFAIMDRALDLGINFFDTADVYGWKQGEGITEQIVGRWFAQGDHRRQRVVLATKCYNAMGKGALADWPNTRGLSKLHIIRACEDSLTRLKTDVIDLYQMHHVDRRASWDEIWEAMDLLKSQGKVLYVGSSNFAGWHISQANEAAKRRVGLGLISEQSKYSLLQREVEMEVVPACLHYGLGIMPWSPLGSGLLAGSNEKSEGGRRSEGGVQEWMEKEKPRLEKWEALCGELGHAPANVALAWLLSRPAVAAPIIGPRTMEQLDGAMGALEVELDEAALSKIDEIFPGFKTSPEHYAW